MKTPTLPADPAEARAYLDRCHKWLMALDLWDERQERLFEERGLQWIEMDTELRCRERLMREARDEVQTDGTTAGRPHEAPD
jgi:acyl transferase domain-containing protein